MYHLREDLYDDHDVNVSGAQIPNAFFLWKGGAVMNLVCIVYSGDSDVLVPG